jgi:hypothetical protein
MLRQWNPQDPSEYLAQKSWLPFQLFLDLYKLWNYIIFTLSIDCVANCTTLIPSFLFLTNCEKILQIHFPLNIIPQNHYPFFIYLIMQYSVHCWVRVSLQEFSSKRWYSKSNFRWYFSTNHLTLKTARPCKP